MTNESTLPDSTTQAQEQVKAWFTNKDAGRLEYLASRNDLTFSDYAERRLLGNLSKACAQVTSLLAALAAVQQELKELQARMDRQSESDSPLWVVVIPQQSWTTCYGTFPNYDACTEWLRANGWHPAEANIHPVQAIAKATHP